MCPSGWFNYPCWSLRNLCIVSCHKIATLHFAWVWCWGLVSLARPGQTPLSALPSCSLALAPALQIWKFVVFAMTESRAGGSLAGLAGVGVGAQSGFIGNCFISCSFTPGLTSMLQSIVKLWSNKKCESEYSRGATEVAARAWHWHAASK